jgi:hypothetical protein
MRSNLQVRHQDAVNPFVWVRHHEISMQGGCVMNLLCKLLLLSCLVAYWRRQPRRSC